jgi:hypothetical protein
MRLPVVLGTCFVVALQLGWGAAAAPSTSSSWNRPEADLMEEAYDELARRLFERARRQRAAQADHPLTTGSLVRPSPIEPRLGSIWRPEWSLLDPHPLGPSTALTLPTSSR